MKLIPQVQYLKESLFWCNKPGPIVTCPCTIQRFYFIWKTLLLLLLWLLSTVAANGVYAGIAGKSALGHLFAGRRSHGCLQIFADEKYAL